MLKLLQEFEELFDGTLGDWDCNPVSLQLTKGAQPYHGRPFPIPKKHVETLKKEIQRLCDLGVLKWQADSEWALPTFIIPKKDNTIRFVSDFREINKWIVRKPFPIPKISTVLQELKGFTYATALDLNMGYLLYHSIGSRCVQNMYHYLTIGKFYLPQGTNGCCMFS